MTDRDKRRRLIEKAWESYNRDVVAPEAGEIQRKETRLAFYAGADTLMRGIMGNLDEGDEPTDDDLERLDDLQQELDEFELEVHLAAHSSRH